MAKKVKPPKPPKPPQLINGIVRFDYNLITYYKFDLEDEIHNFYSPIAGEQLVLTRLRVKCPNDAEVVIYEASSPTSHIIDKEIYRELFQTGDSMILDLNLIITPGVFLNGTATNDEAFVAIVGHYLPVPV